MSKTVMVIDDEKDLVSVMKSFFEMSDYHVVTAYNGTEALQKLSCNPDVVLLDINMPDIDGLTICKTIREHITCPILFLTARIETADKIKGFSAGADDYIVKPFAFEELSARIRSIGRRNGSYSEDNLLSFGDITYDTGLRELKGPGNTLQLSGREGRLLEVFLQNPETSLRRMVILSRVWGTDAEVEEGNLDTYIHFLRKRLKYVESRLNLKTIRGVGYILEN